MELLSHPVFFGAIGGFMLNFASLLELHNVPREQRPNFKDFFYWLQFVAWPLIGALLVHLYCNSGYKMEGLLAFHTGVASPAIIKSFIKEPPKMIPTAPGA